MTVRYLGSTAEHPANNNDIVGAATGGTLAGSQYVQVVFDDTKFDSTPEGKQRLVAALELIVQRIQTARVWPITSSS